MAQGAGETEWDEILRKQGILPPKPVAVDDASEAVDNGPKHVDDETIEELEENEDEDLIEDDGFMAQYREQRLAELKRDQYRVATKGAHGQVYPITRAEYGGAVTEASRTAPAVLLLLTAESDQSAESHSAEQIWKQLASRYGEVKFCQIRANRCIEDYPDTNTPTILVYRNGELVRQLVTLRELGGVKAAEEDFEGLLVSVGAIEEADSRIRHKTDQEDGKRSKRRNAGLGTVHGADEESD